jgi:hypothetical protein
MSRGRGLVESALPSIPFRRRRVRNNDDRPIYVGRAVQGTPRKTLDDARRHIESADEHVRASLERIASAKNRVVASLVRIAQSSSSTFRKR